MQAITFQDVERVEASAVAEPRLQSDGDAIVQVEYSAICGSDLHVFHGRERGLDPGTVMGHEFVGQIVDAGRSGLRTGQRVAAPFTTACGRCTFCLRGLSARCVRGQLFGWRSNGEGLHGGQAEFVRVPLAATSLFALPEELPSEVGLLLGDILGTGSYAVRQAQLEAGQAVAVIGCGPVGLMAILAAREVGAEPIYAIDRVPERLRFAERFGAEAIEGEQVVARLRELQPDGLPAVIDAVGTPQATRLAYELLQAGGVISIVGVHTEPTLNLSPAELYDKNVQLSIGRSPARSLMPALVALARKHTSTLRSIFTHRMLLEEGVEAYRLFAGREAGCLKILLMP